MATIQARYWERCFFCQTIHNDSKYKIVDPRKNTCVVANPDIVLSSYKLALENIKQMKNLNAIPDEFIFLDFDIDNDDGIKPDIVKF